MLAKGTQVYLVTKVQSVDKRTGQQTVAMPNMEGTIDWAGPGNNGGFRYRVYVPQAGGAVWCSPSQINVLGAPEQSGVPNASFGDPEDRLPVPSFTVDPQQGIQRTITSTRNGAAPTVLMDTWERRMSAKIYTLENMEDGEHYRRTLEWIIDGMIARRV